MPFKSKRQQRYMEWAAKHGKIKQSVVEEFEAATPDFKSLPESAPARGKKPVRRKR